MKLLTINAGSTKEENDVETYLYLMKDIIHEKLEEAFMDFVVYGECKIKIDI